MTNNSWMARAFMAFIVGLAFGACANATEDDSTATATAGSSLSKGTIGVDDDADGIVDENGEGKTPKTPKVHPKNDGVDNDGDGTIDEHGEHVPRGGGDDDGDVDEGSDESGDSDGGVDEDSDEDMDEGADEGAGEDMDEGADEGAAGGAGEPAEGPV